MKEDEILSHLILDFILRMKQIAQFISMRVKDVS
jgi:hypothetical protein